MRATKRLLGLIIAITVLFSMTGVSFASTQVPVIGTITYTTLPLNVDATENVNVVLTETSSSSVARTYWVELCGIRWRQSFVKASKYVTIPAGSTSTTASFSVSYTNSGMVYTQVKVYSTYGGTLLTSRIGGSPDTVYKDYSYLNTENAVKTYVESVLGSGKWEYSTAGNVNLVIIRGGGSGAAPSSDYPYDDLFIVVNKGGTVKHYKDGNAEGTRNSTYVSSYGYTKYKDSLFNQYCTGQLAQGRYKFKVGTHSGYKALNVMDYATESQSTLLPSLTVNGSTGALSMNGIDVHKGGETWNYSTGCLTVRESTQWSNFISNFTSGDWGRLYIIG